MCIHVAILRRADFSFTDGEQVEVKPETGGVEAPPSQAAPEKGEPIPETETLATAHRVRPPTSLHCIQFDRAEQILPVDP